MMPKTLRVRPRGDALVQDHERLDAGVNAFVGRRFQELPDTPGQHGFVPTGEDATVPYRAEYLKALQDGDLLPADEATAKVAGVKFVPVAPQTARELPETSDAFTDVHLEPPRPTVAERTTTTPSTPNALRDLTKGRDS